MVLGPRMNWTKRKHVMKTKKNEKGKTKKKTRKKTTKKRKKKQKRTEKMKSRKKTNLIAKRSNLAWKKERRAVRGREYDQTTSRHRMNEKRVKEQ